MINDIQKKRLTVDLDAQASRIGHLFVEPQDAECVDYLRVWPAAPHAWFVCDTVLQMVFVDGVGRLVLFDARKESETCGAVEEVLGGAQQPLSVYIPAGVAYGWQALDGHCVWISATRRDSKVTQLYPLETTLIPFAW